MTENTPPADTRSSDIWKIAPGVLVSLIALAVLFIIVDWREFILALQHADYRYLFLSLPVYLLSYLTRARAWQIVLLNEAPFKKVFLTQQVGYMLNNLLPFRVGELGRAYLLGRTGLGFWRVFSTILVERAFDMLLAVGLLLGTLPFVVEIPGARQLAGIVGAFVLFGLVILYLLALKQARVLTWFENLGGRWPRLVELGRERLRSFLTGLSALADPIRFLRSFLWMGISWLLAIFVQYSVLRAYVPDAQILWAAFALGVAALGVALPSSPGSIGIYETAFVSALAIVGVPFSQALAYALTTHVMYYLVTGIFGAYGLAQEGESITNLFQTIRRQPPIAAEDS